MFELTFLEADRPLVKSYALDSKGLLVKESYPNASEFTSHVERVDGVHEFARTLSAHADFGHCLLKGSLGRPLAAESRAGSTEPNALTPWLCFDFDRTGRIASIDEAMALLKFGDVSYVIQYSASYGVEPEKGLTAHVFVLLDRATSPSALKQWLIGLNLRTPWLVQELGLTKTNNALSWPLDISTCQNDKLIYIAGPKLGKGVKSEFRGERIQVVEKALPTLGTDRLVVPSAEQNRLATHTELDRLRRGLGLAPRKWKYRTDKASGLEVLDRPDASTLTGIKEERGFTYFNLNGGDSWGYYHPNEAPEVIRNFKGEACYATEELLPEYWEQIQQAKRKARHAKRSKEVQVLAFRDFKSAVYYNGTWDGSELRLARATSETQLQHYLLEHGQPGLESIPIWDLVYDPSKLDERVDLPRKRVNLFSPSNFMEPKSGLQWAASDSLSRRCPTILSLIRSAVGRDEALGEHWLNWTACILRHRVRTLVAWILQGVEGTGKGILVNHVLLPLLGRSNVAIKRMMELEDTFNPYIEFSVLAVIDEAQISGSKKADMIMANLKHQITEPEVSIRKMYSASYSAPNHCSFLFLSNMNDPVVIGATDRRFCCGEYGQTKFPFVPGTTLEAIASELEAFAAYLHFREADLAKAGTVFESEARDLMKATSTNSIDATAQALLKGDISFFWDSLPSGNGGILGAEAQALYDSYTALVHAALRAEDGVQKLTRDEVRVLFAYNVGEIAKTPTKFTSLLRHHRVQLSPLRINDRIVRGVEAKWAEPEPGWRVERLRELGDAPRALRAVA